MQDWMIGLVVILVGGLFILGVIWGFVQLVCRAFLRLELRRLSKALLDSIVVHFLVEACSRCHETEMELLDISPNGRSIHYKCRHCGKAKRSAAGAPGGVNDAALFQRLNATFKRFVSTFPPNAKVSSALQFSTVAGPLPYERTTREPIPEAVRIEVWRRDAGRCVRCGAKEQLEFDHIIPVSKGGATSARNLQLLCKQCNLAKATSI